MYIIIFERFIITQSSYEEGVAIVSPGTGGVKFFHIVPKLTKVPRGGGSKKVGKFPKFYHV